MTVIKTRGIVSPASNPVIAFFSALWRNIEQHPLEEIALSGSNNFGFDLILFVTLFLRLLQDFRDPYIYLLVEY